MNAQLRNPAAVLDGRFSTTGAEPIRWAEGRALIEDAEIFWLATTRRDGQPHVTPLMMVCVDDALYFGTGADEQKGRNLATNPRVTVTTGNNAFRSGTDVIIEGIAERVTEPQLLQRVADRFLSKYEWKYEVTESGFRGEGGNVALVFRVNYAKGFAFQRGAEFGQTRWNFRNERV
jgi:PPOX class probable F420-dependent enzyme